MIRLTLLLLVGLFATLQIEGRDTGQMRFGLIEAEKDAEILAKAAAAKPVNKAPVETVAIGNAATPIDRVPQDVEVAFATTPRVIAPAATETASATPQPAAEKPGDVRYVTGGSVNVRGGPSTRDGVIEKLSRGDAVTVVWVEDNGWARIRIEGDGIDGYIAVNFLTDVAP